MIAQGVDVNQQGGETKVLVQFVICLFSPIFYDIVIQYNTNSHLPTQANMKSQLSTLPRSMGTPTLLTGWSRLYAQQTTLIKFFIDFEYFSELVC